MNETKKTIEFGALIWELSNEWRLLAEMFSNGQLNHKDWKQRVIELNDIAELFCDMEKDTKKGEAEV